ncbi:MAG: hypothetical protein WCY67_08180 [Acidithiobacillus sp.]
MPAVASSVMLPASPCLVGDEPQREAGCPRFSFAFALGAGLRPHPLAARGRASQRVAIATASHGGGSPRLRRSASAATAERLAPTRQSKRPSAWLWFASAPQ